MTRHWSNAVAKGWIGWNDPTDEVQQVFRSGWAGTVKGFGKVAMRADTGDYANPHLPLVHEEPWWSIWPDHRWKLTPLARCRW
ncbi:hypothetical protein GCM10027590_32570 [Nocardiopsis nanhaiensis]